MGSEMCIRDRVDIDLALGGAHEVDSAHAADVFQAFFENLLGPSGQLHGTCLLYTSDAADERSSVDLGGRRIIKKKKQQDIVGTSIENKKLH